MLAVSIEVFWPVAGSKRWMRRPSMSTHHRTPASASQTGPSPRIAWASRTSSAFNSVVMARMMPHAGCYDRPVVVRRFDGKAVLVTGSTGIAAASAQRLAAEGASVVVASRTEAHCRSLAEAITSAGGTASFEVADLLDDDAADRVVATTLARHGRLDGVFHVAGGSGRRYGDGPAHAATPGGWDA